MVNVIANRNSGSLLVQAKRLYCAPKGPCSGSNLGIFMAIRQARLEPSSPPYASSTDYRKTMASRCGISTVGGSLCKCPQKQRADERTRTADLTSLRGRCSPSGCNRTAYEPNCGLIRPNLSTEATLNGLLVVAPTHRCRKRRIAPPLFFRHAPLPVAKSHPGSVRRET